MLVDQAEGADVAVVNTCAFIGPAKEQSVETVLSAVDRIKPIETADELIDAGADQIIDTPIELLDLITTGS